MTNNGVERQHRALKYDYLLSYRNSTLSGLITVLVERFHPDSYRKYVDSFQRFRVARSPIAELPVPVRIAVLSDTA